VQRLEDSAVVGIGTYSSELLIGKIRELQSAVEADELE